MYFNKNYVRHNKLDNREKEEEEEVKEAEESFIGGPS